MFNKPRPRKVWTRLREQLCPNCNSPQKFASDSTGGDYRPRVGDGAICMDCLEFLVFDAELNLRRMTEEDRTGRFVDVLPSFEEHKARILKQRGAS